MQYLISALPTSISQGLIWGLMAIGLYITNKILDISDLTVDGSIVTGAAVCTMLMIGGTNPWIAMLIATLAGGLCGLVTGLFHTVLEIPAILSGILTQLALWSVNYKILGQANRPLFPDNDNYHVIITQRDNNEAIWMLILIALAIIGILYWFFGTSLGCSIRATGCNLNMSRAQGINTNVNKVLGLMISNGVVALSGALLAQYQGFCDITNGRGAIVTGLVGIVIGELFFSKIARNFAVRLLGVLIGAIVYQVVIQIVVFMGLDTNYLKLLSAIVVAIFLGVPNLKNKLFAKFNNKKSAKEVKENA